MRLKALLKLRCPHCLQGEVFSSLLKMRETCPVCGIRFEREPGYFLMAIFFGYGLATAVALPVVLVSYLMNAPVYWYFLGVGVVLFSFSPWIFRYARMIWLHLDEFMDPRRLSEKPGFCCQKK